MFTENQIRGHLHLFALFESYAPRCSQSRWSAFESWIISTPSEWKMIVVTTTKHYYSGQNTLWISSKKEDNIGVDTGGLMKLITPFTILNQNFHEMDLIRDAMKNRRLATERLHDDYRKIYKNQFA